MSAQNTVDDKQKRRRRRRADVEEEDSIDEAEEAVDEARGLTESKGRATPGRRTQVEPEEQGNIVIRTLRGIREYFEGVRSELDKVAWPTREETLRLSGIVLVTLIVCSIVLGSIGALFTEVVRLGLAAPIIFVVIFVVVVAVALYFMRRGAGRTSPF